MDANLICKKLAILEGDRSNIERVWELIKKYVANYRNDYYTDATTEGGVDWTARHLFDSTAQVSSQILAYSVHGALTNQSTQWFDFRFRDQELDKDTAAVQWLKRCAKIVYDALQDSNFNIEILEAYLDLVGPGITFLSQEFDETATKTESVFAALPTQECYFNEDHNGQIYEFFRKRLWTPTEIKSKFGDKTPLCIMEMCDAGKTERQEVVFSVFRRANYSAQIPAAPNMRPFGGKYVLVKTKEQMGDELGYYEMPVYVARWGRSPNSKWGYSPSFVAMPDILTLNQLVELILRATEKAVDPATVATERGLLSDLDLSAGGLTMVRDIEGIKPFESRARFDVSELQREKLISSIRQVYMVDQLQLKDSPAMTATETQVRYELMQRLLGPTAARIKRDLLDPLVERTFRALWRSNRLPTPPDSIKGSAAELDILYTGPLDRAQKVDAAAATERWLMGISNAAQFDAQALDLVDIDAVVRGQASDLDVPADYIRNNDKVVTMRKQRQQQMAQQQQLMDAQAAGAAMEAVGKGAAAVGGKGNA